MKIGSDLPTAANASIYQKERTQDQGFQRALEEARESKDEKKLMEACKQMESVFLNMAFKAMRSTVQTSELMPKSFERETFEGMFDEKVAESITTGRGVGLAQQMYRQLSRHLESEVKPIEGTQNTVDLNEKKRIKGKEEE